MLAVAPSEPRLARRTDWRGPYDTRKFRGIVEAMNEYVELTLAEGLFQELRELRRHVAERYDDATEAVEEADLSSVGQSALRHWDCRRC